jgi:drug/metabolite transporter (DMT)-like permease
MESVQGPRSHPESGFGALEWALLAAAAIAWGASFYFIEVGLDHFEPGAVAFLRVLFGAAVLALIPAARRPVERADLGGVALLGAVWMAVPFVLFAIAQQSIDSSLAGMINAAAPLFTAAIAAVLVRRLPSRIRGTGLLIGILGVAVISIPSIEGGSSGLGVALVAIATFLYGCAFNLNAALQRRNETLPVVLRAQLAALVLLAPIGAVGIAGSEFAWSSAAAVFVLGTVGTGAAFVWFAILTARAGATRASLTTYFLPVVAIALGALALDEPIRAYALAGTALVLSGAYLATRGRA